VKFSKGILREVFQRREDPGFSSTSAEAESQEVSAMSWQKLFAVTALSLMAVTFASGGDIGPGDALVLIFGAGASAVGGIGGVLYAIATRGRGWIVRLNVSNLPIEERAAVTDAGLSDPACVSSASR
jgi:hypothetical protein